MERKSQSVPYIDCPAFTCDALSHDECWRDYDRQEEDHKERFLELYEVEIDFRDGW